MSNFKKLMMSSAGGGGNFYLESVLTDGAIGGPTAIPGLQLNQNVKYETHFLSDGTTVHCYNVQGTLPDGTTSTQGALYTKLGTDGTVLWSKRVANQLAGDSTSYPRCLHYGSVVDSSDNLYIVGQVNYVSTPYGTNSWPYVLKIDTSDGSVEKLMVYSLYNAQYGNNDRGWFEDIKINKSNGNLVCAGVMDVTGVGYRGSFFEINPSTLAIVGARLIGNGGAYFNCVETDSSGNIYVAGYDNYSYSSVIKLNSSYTVQTSKNLDQNGGLVESISEKDGNLYVARYDSAILSGYSSVPIAVTKLANSNFSVVWSQGHADPSFNGYGVRKIRFDSNGDLIVANLFPGNYRSLAGVSGIVGSGISKLSDVDGSLDWAVIFTPYSSNSAAGANYRLYQYGIAVSADDLIATTAEDFFYYYANASDFKQVRSPSAAVLSLEDLEGINFTSDSTALYSTDDVSWPQGLKIVDVTSYFTLSGTADSSGTSGISTSTTNPTVAATDATSQVQIADVTYSEENLVAI